MTMQIGQLEKELAGIDESRLRDEIQMLTAEVEHYKIMSTADSDSAQTAQNEAKR